MVKSINFSQISIIKGKNALSVPMIAQSWLFWRSLFHIIDLDEGHILVVKKE